MWRGAVWRGELPLHMETLYAVGYPANSGFLTMWRTLCTANSLAFYVFFLVGQGELTRGRGSGLNLLAVPAFKLTFLKCWNRIWGHYVFWRGGVWAPFAALPQATLCLRLPQGFIWFQRIWRNGGVFCTFLLRSHQVHIPKSMGHPLVFLFSAGTSQKYAVQLFKPKHALLGGKVLEKEYIMDGGT